MAKITFTIPFYSTPEYLDAAVQSVLRQTESEWELIIVDDQSPHRSIPDQVKNYNDKRISYCLNEKNLGQSGNWNQCLKLAKTDLVTILHADDQLHRNYACTMLEALSQFPEASAYFCRADIIDSSGKNIFSFPDWYKKFLVPSINAPFTLSGEAGLQSLIRGNFIMCPTICYRVSRLNGVRFSPDWKCTPDLEFVSRHLIDGGVMVGLPNLAFSYRRHLESGTSSFIRSLQMFKEEVALFTAIEERARTRGWFQAAKAASSKRIIKLRLAYFGMRDLLCLRPVAAFTKFRYLIEVVSGQPKSVTVQEI